MNFKALITTLVLGSSSAAMADTSFQVSGSVTFGTAPTHMHVPARPIPAPTSVVLADDCVDPYSHVVKQPVQMGVWRGPYFNPTNTTIGVSKSIYTGSIGYIAFTGEMDLNIVIRTILVKDSVAYVNVGGGVVWDSLPPSEYKETLNKARSQLMALHHYRHAPCY